MENFVKFQFGQELLAWDVFRSVPISLLNKARLFHVYGLPAESGIFVTTDDQVYAIGKNDEGQLGIGENGDITEPRLVSELCGKRVIRLKFIIALTEEGHVYSFGDARWGMSGIVTRERSVNTPRLISSISEEKIAYISCGAYFTLALSKEGKVFTWGNNDWFQTATEGSDILEPIQIFDSTGVKICSISAGSTHSVALTETGSVYTWGDNSLGQLGQCHSITNISTPTLVDHISGVPIVQISISERLTTFLTEKGLVYSTGLNKHREYTNNVHWKSPVLLTGLPKQAGMKHRLSRFYPEIIERLKVTCYWVTEMIPTFRGRCWPHPKGNCGLIICGLVFIVTQWLKRNMISE